MTNLVITRTGSISDAEACKRAMDVAGEALSLNYIEGPLEEAVNDIILGKDDVTIEFFDEKVKNIDGLLSMQREKVFSTLGESEEKMFSIRTIHERMKTMRLPMIKQMRLLIRDNKRYYKAALRKMQKDPQMFQDLKELFITDFMHFFSEVLPAVSEGEEKLAQVLGLTILAPKSIKAARLMQRDLIMMNKIGGAPKALLQRAQNNFAAFIDSITDVVFPKWREIFADTLNTDEVALDESEDAETEEKQFSETKEYANEQQGEEAEGEFMELTPAEEKLLRRESQVEGDGATVFSQKEYSNNFRRTAGLLKWLKKENKDSRPDDNNPYILKNRKFIEKAVKEGYDRYLFFNTHNDAFEMEHTLEDKYDIRTTSLTDYELGESDKLYDGNVHEIILVKEKEEKEEPVAEAPAKGEGEQGESFSKKTCSSLLKKNKRQFGVTQNQRAQMDHTQEELEEHPELPGSMGVHEDKNELEELNPLKKEKADTGKDVSAKNGEDHGHGITPKGEKTFAFDGMPMEGNEYKSVDRHSKGKSCSQILKKNKRSFPTVSA